MVSTENYPHEGLGLRFPCNERTRLICGLFKDHILNNKLSGHLYKSGEHGDVSVLRGVTIKPLL